MSARLRDTLGTAARCGSPSDGPLWTSDASLPPPRAGGRRGWAARTRDGGAEHLARPTLLALLVLLALVDGRPLDVSEGGVVLPQHPPSVLRRSRLCLCERKTLGLARKRGFQALDLRVLHLAEAGGKEADRAAFEQAAVHAAVRVRDHLVVHRVRQAVFEHDCEGVGGKIAPGRIEARSGRRRRRRPAPPAARLAAPPAARLAARLAARPTEPRRRASRRSGQAALLQSARCAPDPNLGSLQRSCAALELQPSLSGSVCVRLSGGAPRQPAPTPAAGQGRRARSAALCHGVSHQSGAEKQPVV